MGDLREKVHLIMEFLWLWVPALVWVVLVEVAWTRAVDREPQPGPEDVELAENYLRKFYHFNPGSGRRRVRSASQLEEKMREMQNFFGLRETGRLNPETLEVMRTSRCGVPDVENFSFYPGKPKWSNSTITFTIAKYTPDMRREDVETSFRAALKLWSDAAPLKFLRVRDQSRADVVLSFTSRMHGDFSPFDGPGGVLAHAFQPGEGMGGDVHFDEDETWTTGSQGYSLSAVAAHELGHSLGLTHSRDPSAVMFPSYRYDSSTQRSLTMSDDDVHAIQTLYGKPSKNGNTQNIPSKCDPNVSFDAATMMGNNIVFFKNKSVWVRTTRSTYWNQLTEARGGEYFPGLSSPVDAAFDIPAKGAVYIFTGHKYWVVEQPKKENRRLGSIYEYGFSPRVGQIDAAVHIGERGKTMFFTGEVYYRYDEKRRRMDPGYPRPIHTDWPGVPTRVNAAFRFHGSVFFLSGMKSYQFDLRKNQVVKVIPANSWLGC